MKNLTIALFFFLLFSCKSKPETLISKDILLRVEKRKLSCFSPMEIRKKKGFRYKVPEDMREAPEYAYRFRYDNLLLEKGSDYHSSPIVIAIRHFDLKHNQKLIDFAKEDQSYLRQSIKPAYQKGWKPQGLEEKNIEYAMYEFTYKRQKNHIYQRSVYLRCKDRVHIISLSSLYKEILNRENTEEFWNSIRID